MGASTRKDFLYDDDGDLLIENGDFAIGLSDDQNVQDILSANKGDYRQYPTVGVELIKFLKKQDNDFAKLKREITVNLESDGYRVADLAFNSAGEINIDFEANYGMDQ